MGAAHRNARKAAMIRDNENYQQEVWSAWGAALAGLVFAATVWNGNLMINVV